LAKSPSGYRQSGRHRFSKVIPIRAVCMKYTWALTFDHFCQELQPGQRLRYEAMAKSDQDRYRLQLSQSKLVSPAFPVQIV
jgi:hypothetical protein